MGLFGKILGREELKSGLEPQAGKQQVGNSPASAIGAQGGNVFRVKDIYQITGIGIVAVGVVESGTICPGQKTLLNGKQAMIKTIEAKHQVLESAVKGQSIGINLKGVNKEDLQPGMSLNFTLVNF
ncbi:MAG: EF-Tu/IF-2/RF-3 family GTPase [archaeon]|jgi:GTPase|nr:EF-Tu/IF-2/RF-3 family GTPase [archaeon]